MKHLIMGTAGHVDHGKTALIKMLTDIDCDTHKEEKRRGITINLGFTFLNLTNGESIGIIDVPGHKDFINTMVGGACGIDFVLLVIAADSGIMPQTVEHLNIITALGIKKGIVALTKIDLVDDDLIEMAKYEIIEHLENTSLKDATVIGVSAITGKGKDELITAIENIVPEVEEKEKESLFRMYIDRIFTVKGFGNVVTGSVLGGSVESGSDVFLLPGKNLKLRVRSIERHGHPVKSVVAGDRAAINLIGLKSEDYQRGMIISNKEIKETSMIDAAVSLFDKDLILPLWTNINFHTGTYECSARMHTLNTDNIKQGEDAIVQIHLAKPAVILNKDKFIIRNSSGDKTLGGGYVIDVAPLHHKKRPQHLIENLTNLSEKILSENSVNEVIHLELKKEFRPFSPEEIAEKLNLKVEEINSVILDGKSGFLIYHDTQTDILIDNNHDITFRNKIIKILSDQHKDCPILPDGYETVELLGKLGLSKIKNGKAYLNLLLAEMEKNEQIERYKNSWIIKGFRPVIDQQSINEINWLENEIKNYGLVKPVLLEIEEKAAISKIPKSKLKMYLTYLARQKKIYFYQSDFIHASVVDQYRNVLLDMLKDKAGGIEINDFKDKIGATKRFCNLLVSIYESQKILSTEGSGIETKIFIT